MRGVRPGHPLWLTRRTLRFVLVASIRAVPFNDAIRFHVVDEPHSIYLWIRSVFPWFPLFGFGEWRCAYAQFQWFRVCVPLDGEMLDHQRFGLMLLGTANVSSKWCYSPLHILPYSEGGFSFLHILLCALRAVVLAGMNCWLTGILTRISLKFKSVVSSCICCIW